MSEPVKEKDVFIDELNESHDVFVISERKEYIIKEYKGEKIEFRDRFDIKKGIFEKNKFSFDKIEFSYVYSDLIIKTPYSHIIIIKEYKTILQK